MKQKQQAALEKVTGKPWNSWNPEAVSAYFAFTDKGKKVMVSPEAQEDYNELMECHHWHAVDIEIYKQDFKSGILFLDDFIDEVPRPPDNYLRHIFEVYKSVHGFIPSRYEKWAKHLGVSRFAF